MGRVRGPYKADFPEGSTVRIASKDVLKGFQRPQWAYHNPLSDAQLDQAGKVCTVQSVGFYHGGDDLYELQGVAGIWHEGCLELVS
jgi:hypothetical protein